MERLGELRQRYGGTEPIEAYFQALEVDIEVQQKRHAAVERLSDQLMTRIVMLESR